MARAWWRCSVSGIWWSEFDSRYFGSRYFRVRRWSVFLCSLSVDSSISSLVLDSIGPHHRRVCKRRGGGVRGKSLVDLVFLPARRLRFLSGNILLEILYSAFRPQNVFEEAIYIRDSGVSCLTKSILRYRREGGVSPTHLLHVSSTIVSSKHHPKAQQPYNI